MPELIRHNDFVVLWMGFKNLELVQNTLEDAGVIFIDRNEDGGPGVRLK